MSTLMSTFCAREFVYKYRFCTKCGRLLEESVKTCGFDAKTGKLQGQMIYTCPERHMAIHTEPAPLSFAHA